MIRTAASPATSCRIAETITVSWIQGVFMSDVHVEAHLLSEIG